MDLQKLIAQAEGEIADKRNEADKYLHEAKATLAEAKTKKGELSRQEIELGKFQAEIDKKIAKLESLEAIERSDRDRAILKDEANELMVKAQKMMEEANDKRIAAEIMSKASEETSARLKANASDYKKKLKEAAIANLVDMMFKEV